MSAISVPSFDFLNLPRRAQSVVIDKLRRVDGAATRDLINLSTTSKVVRDMAKEEGLFEVAGVKARTDSLSQELAAMMRDPELLKNTRVIKFTVQGDGSCLQVTVADDPMGNLAFEVLAVLGALRNVYSVKLKLLNCNDGLLHELRQLCTKANREQWTLHLERIQALDLRAYLEDGSQSRASYTAIIDAFPKQTFGTYTLEGRFTSTRQVANARTIRKHRTIRLVHEKSAFIPKDLIELHGKCPDLEHIMLQGLINARFNFSDFIDVLPRYDNLVRLHMPLEMKTSGADGSWEAADNRTVLPDHAQEFFDGLPNLQELTFVSIKDNVSFTFTPGPRGTSGELPPLIRVYESGWHSDIVTGRVGQMLDRREVRNEVWEQEWALAARTHKQDSQ